MRIRSCRFPCRSGRARPDRTTPAGCCCYPWLVPNLGELIQLVRYDEQGVLGAALLARMRCRRLLCITYTVTAGRAVSSSTQQLSERMDLVTPVGSAALVGHDGVAVNHCYDQMQRHPLPDAGATDRLTVHRRGQTRRVGARPGGQVSGEYPVTAVILWHV